MRKCPTCGTGYADTDFRTLCGTCMVNLVPVTEETASTDAPAAGPVGLEALAPAPAPIITVTMPTVEIAIPEIHPPHLPEIPGLPEPVPEPEPGPMPAPLTPQPTPNPAVPPIIPTPVPVPVPQPAPLPPDPAQPAAAQQEVVSRRAVPQEDRQRSGAQASLYTFWSVICGAGTFFLFMPFWLGGDGGFFAFLLTVAGTIGAVACIRQVIYAQTISHVSVTPVTPPRLGGSLPLRVTIGALRAIEMTEAVVTVEAQETAVRGSGKSRTTHTHVLFSRQVDLPFPRQWRANEELTTTVEVNLPADAPSSFTGSNNRIDWRVRFTGAIPGWYPDIRVKNELPVLPICAGEPRFIPHDYRYTLPELGTLRGELQLLCGQEAGSLRPILAAGSRVPFTLSLTPVAGAPNQKVWVELLYRVDGSGSNESSTVARIQCFPHGWEAGETQTASGVLAIPADGPLTYQGTHVRVAWMLMVRHEIPWKSDKRQLIPVLLLPRAEG